eukprot:5786731-Alexandrium_andersonii.AAC.1
MLGGRAWPPQHLPSLQKSPTGQALRLVVAWQAKHTHTRPSCRLLRSADLLLGVKSKGPFSCLLYTSPSPRD